MRDIVDEILQVSDDGLSRVRLVQDTDATNPQAEYDHLGHVLTVPHPRFTKISEEGGPLEDGWDRLDDHHKQVEIFIRWARIFHGAVVLHDTPNEGPSAIWYMLPAQFGEVEDPAKCLESERDEYREWASGEVYGYVIESPVTYVEVGGDRSINQWEEAEDGSLWGLIGFEYARDTALAAFEEHITAGV